MRCTAKMRLLLSYMLLTAFSSPPQNESDLLTCANMLPAMGFAMLGRMILNKESMPFFFLGFLLCSYVGMPVLGVALLAIIIVIEKFNLLGGGMDAQLALEEDDDDF